MRITTSRRARRTLLAVAAAAVVLIPTACDSASGAVPVPSNDGGDHDHGGGDYGQGGYGQRTVTAPVVPVADTTPDHGHGTGSPESDDPAVEDPGAPAGPADPDAPDKDLQADAEAPDRADGPEDGRDSGAPGIGDGGDPAPPTAPEVLARDCSGSDLDPHDGFQNAPACVNTGFGEVSGAERNPTLLITDIPENVVAGEDFEILVSTRNLVRDRFLGAADGGYYLESSVLTDEGIQRGHFHVACRMLESADTAPQPAPAPAFFKGVEDGEGGVDPDTVSIEVPGLPTAGTAQCAVWAGDGSHRVPMMQRANQIPAFDVARVTIT